MRTVGALWGNPPDRTRLTLRSFLLGAQALIARDDQGGGAVINRFE
jgi:hypothetical protein